MHINEAKDKRVKDILNSAGQLVVPRFQRPYSWKEEKINEFFEDILQDISVDYFIGALVLYKINNNKGIIDGQQRLTTIMISLAAIRDNFIALNELDLAKGIHINYIEKKDDQNKEYYKISTETSYPFFQHSILPFEKEVLDEKLTQEEEIVKKASDYIKKILSDKIKDKTKDEKLKILTEIKNRILDLSTVYIELDNEDDAYQIFETLNTRGEDLSLADRIKNHLFRFLISKNLERDTAKKKWRDLLKILNDSSVNLTMDDFIYHRWNSCHPLTTKLKIFKAFKNEITNKEKAKKEIDSLSEDVKLYRFMNEPDFFISEKLNNRLIVENLKVLSILGIKLGHPALLAILKKYETNEISIKNILSFLKKMVKFHFIFNTMLSSRSSGITNRYVSLAQNISLGQSDKNSEVRNFMLFSQSFLDSKDAIKQSFKSLIFTNQVSKNKKIVQYVLSCFERFYSKNDKKDTSNLTIEHLLPQSLLKNGYSQEQIGQLGNLILVDDAMQEKLRNKPLKEKLKILKANNIKVYYLDDVSDNVDDNIQLITDRTDKMFENDFIKIWKID